MSNSKKELFDAETSDEEVSEDQCSNSEGEVFLESETDSSSLDEDIGHRVSKLKRRQTQQDQCGLSSEGHQVQRRSRGRPRLGTRGRGMSQGQDREHDQNISTEVSSSMIVKSDNDAEDDEDNGKSSRKRQRRTEGKQVENHKSILKERGASLIKWSAKQPTNRSSNIVIRIHPPGVIGDAQNADSPVSMWDYLIDPGILNTIVLYTNEEIVKAAANIETTQESIHKKTDLTELGALIGLLYMAGLRKQSQVDVEELWGEEFNVSIFRATMPTKRFKFLIACLRFDNKKTRKHRRKRDRFAAIREIWDLFVDNCQKYYTPNQVCTIDDQIVPFKGQCIFRRYFPHKPDRHGIRFIMMNDSRTSYMYNAFPYLGKVTDNTQNEPNASYFVKKLIEPIRNTNRTIVMNDWFTSVPLFRTLYRQYELEAIGSIRKYKKEIPTEFIKEASLHSLQCTYADELTLLSYVLKNNKIVFMLSNGLNNNEVANTEGKPMLITQYRAHKGGTDTFDQSCKMYTVVRRTGRWSLKIFYSILDKASVNSTILYNLLFPHDKKSRKQFTKDLAMSLITPHLMARYGLPTLRSNVKRGIAHFLGLVPEVKSHEDILWSEKRSRCGFCHYTTGSKTKMKCPECQKAMCTRHRSSLCVDCVSNYMNS